MKKLKETEHFEDFQAYATKYRNMLPVAGITLLNERKQMLCIVKAKSKTVKTLCLPFGKLEYKDKENLKVCGYREFHEETDVDLTDIEFRNLTDYFQIKLNKKIYRFYIVENFGKYVNLEYSSPGEVEKLAWLSVERVIKSRTSSLVPGSNIVTTVDWRDHILQFSFIFKKVLKLVGNKAKNPLKSVGPQNKKKKMMRKRDDSTFPRPNLTKNK